MVKNFSGAIVFDSRARKTCFNYWTDQHLEFKDDSTTKKLLAYRDLAEKEAHIYHELNELEGDVARMNGLAQLFKDHLKLKSEY